MVHDLRTYCKITGLNCTTVPRKPAHIDATSVLLLIEKIHFRVSDIVDAHAFTIVIANMSPTTFLSRSISSLWMMLAITHASSFSRHHYIPSSACDFDFLITNDIQKTSSMQHGLSKFLDFTLTDTEQPQLPS